MAGKAVAAAEAPSEIDVDDMSEEQFAEAKATMAREAASTPAEDGAAAEQPEVAKPAGEAADEGEGDDAEDRRTVSHKDFHRANERRKEAEAEREAIKAERDRYHQRMSELLEAMQPKQPEPAVEVPDPERDIFGYVRHLESELKGLKGESALTKEQAQAQEQFAQVLNSSRGDVEAYAEENPAAPYAMGFLVNSITAELKAYAKAGRRPMSEQAVAEELQKREYDITLWAAERGVRPAEVLYELALARGFDPASVQRGQSSGAAPGNVKAEVERMMRNEDTRNKAKSLGGSGSAGGVDALTTKEVVEMSDEDFAAFKKKHGDNAMRRVFLP